MLNKTKHFLRAHGVDYEKEHVNPLIVPEKVYVLKFGRGNRLNNRFIVEHTYTWTGRIKINNIILRLHGQHHPREFHNEAELLNYLRRHEKAFSQNKKKKKHV
ncbi:hypothetical protein [Ligilactobacillus cholophilus]|uniref:hypothetical protein n=1 Tax=Ligilactobacillus cholophilus TaxID=3050131 RepID=UPI0025B0A948|nr:hypothetical protein [Ligilactobacillus cholophilus]